jgi:Uma2 family endonuclease
MTKAIAIHKLEKEKPVKIYTLQEYLAREAQSPQKNEFYNGQISTMPGSKFKHNEISANMISLVKWAIKPLPQKFRVITSDQKIYIEAENIAVYPDVLVICQEPEYWNQREDLIVNPLLIVEVLSRSTRKYDRGDKFMLYQLLPSFKEYVLIEQNKPCVESWFQQSDKTWNKLVVNGLENTIPLRTLGVTIALEDIYENIVF